MVREEIQLVILEEISKFVIKSQIVIESKNCESRDFE